MKIPQGNPSDPVKKTRRKTHQQRTRANDDQVTELLKICLQKVCEMQAQLEEEEEVKDPEAEGYAACAMEALNFLTAEGLPPNHPMIKTLQERLMGNQR